MQTTLTVGDWSDDGHGKVATHTFEHTSSDLEAAYRRGSLLLGIKHAHAVWDPDYRVVENHPVDDVMGLCADAYEDNSIPDEVVEALMAHGIMPNHFDEATSSWLYPTETYETAYDNSGKYVVSGTEGFAALWMEIARLGEPSLEYTLVKPHNIDVGGYGLFS